MRKGPTTNTAGSVPLAASLALQGKRVPALLSIWPQAGTIAGVSRGTAFRAAARGDWPCLRSGKRLWVVTAKFEELIGRAIEPADFAVGP